MRIYTRLAHVTWRSSNLGGVHLHHMVVGVIIVLAAGMLDISLAPGSTGRAILAVTFGIGGAFILDEFALTFHLRDVYWTEEGRRSIEASVIWLLLGSARSCRSLAVRDPRQDGRPARDRLLGDRAQRPALDGDLPQGQAHPRARQHLPAARGDRDRDPACAAGVCVGPGVLPLEPGEAGSRRGPVPSGALAPRAVAHPLRRPPRRRARSLAARQTRATRSPWAGPLAVDDPAPIAELRHVFVEAGFDGPAVRDALDVDGQMLARPSDGPVLRRRLAGIEPLGTLASLFVLDTPVPVADARRALQPLSLERVEAMGLVELGGGVVRTRIRLVPHDDVLIVSDRSGFAADDQPDHVAGVHNASLTLAKLHPPSTGSTSRSTSGPAPGSRRSSPRGMPAAWSRPT